MLSEEALERLSERLVDRIEELNLFMINKLGEQIMRIGTLTPTQLREIFQSVKYGNDLNEIISKIAEITNKNVADIYNIFEEVAKKNQIFAKQFYDYKKISFIPYDSNVELKSMVNALAKVTADKFNNIAQTSAYAILNSKGDLEYTKLSEVYQKLTDEAILNVSTGRETFEQAMKNTMKELTSRGIQDVNYATGYHRRLDSSVRMNMNDGIKNLTNELQRKFGEEFGANGVEVVHHIYPAPDHSSKEKEGWYDIDGKQFTNEEFKKVNDSLNRQVSDMNCKHLTVPIILGISEPLYSEDQLKADKEANLKGFEFEGNHYTMYEGTQLQRQIETKIRQYKDRQIGAKAINDKDEVYRCQEKLDQLTQKYKNLSDVSGLPTKVDRLRVDGYRKVNINKSLYDDSSDIRYKYSTNEIISKAKDITTNNFYEKTKGVKIERLNENYSYYQPYTNKIYLGKKANEYSLIHELGHKLSFNFTEEEKIQYNNILREKFSFYKKSDFKKIESKTGKYWVLKNSDGFITEYQSRIYDGFRSFVNGKPNIKYAYEYISVGIEYYFKNPRLLKNTDKELYNFIDRMLKDE